MRAVHLDEKGRGRALRATWLASPARVVAYMDVDLSTDLDALLPLVAPLLSGHSDVAIGTRLAPGSRVVRGAKREIISRSYNLILKTLLGNGFSDAQCGFKALRADVARALVPLVDDEGWFFDTELLVLAEHNGLRIHEVPGRLGRRPRFPGRRGQHRPGGPARHRAHAAPLRRRGRHAARRGPPRRRACGGAGPGRPAGALRPGRGC